MANLNQVSELFSKIDAQSGFMGRVGEIKGVVDTIRNTDPAQIGATVRSATEGYRAARTLDQMLPWILGGGAPMPGGFGIVATICMRSSEAALV